MASICQLSWCASLTGGLMRFMLLPWVSGLALSVSGDSHCDCDCTCNCTCTWPWTLPTLPGRPCLSELAWQTLPGRPCLVPANLFPSHARPEIIDTRCQLPTANRTPIKQNGKSNHHGLQVFFFFFALSGPQAAQLRAPLPCVLGGHGPG